LESFDRPQVLPMYGHSCFCHPCLDQLQTHTASVPSCLNRRGLLLRCPLCRCEQRVPLLCGL
jgi:hypothetical protein